MVLSMQAIRKAAPALALVVALAAPTTAGAMLPANAGGGAPAKKVKRKTIKRQKPVRVKRPPGPAPAHHAPCKPPGRSGRVCREGPPNRSRAPG